MALPKISELEPGMSIGQREIAIDRARFVRYAGASGDFNPIHWDEKFATAVGLPSVIGHGMWTMGAAVQLVVDWCGDAGRVVKYGVRFSSPVVVEYENAEPVLVEGAVKSVDGDQAVIELTTTQAGQKVLTRALVTVDLQER